MNYPDLVKGQNMRQISNLVHFSYQNTLEVLTEVVAVTIQSSLKVAKMSANVYFMHCTYICTAENGVSIHL